MIQFFMWQIIGNFDEMCFHRIVEKVRRGTVY